MSVTNFPFQKIKAWSVGLSATIYTIFQYGLKLFKVYNGEYVTSVTGMDALVIELISFFMTAIVIGWLMSKKPQEDFGKQFLQISAIIIFSPAVFRGNFKPFYLPPKPWRRREFIKARTGFSCFS